MTRPLMIFVLVVAGIKKVLKIGEKDRNSEQKLKSKTYLSTLIIKST